MISFYNKRTQRVSSAASGAFSITPGASALVRPTYGGILVGGAGTITLTTVDGDAGVLVTVVAGQYVPIAASHVTAATATGLIGLDAR